MTNPAHTGFWLRRASRVDVDAVHRLLSFPAVNRYLADGETPPRSAVDAWMAASERDFARAGAGVWVLVEGDEPPEGCVRLEVDPAGREAELTYLLAPRLWGSGLATAMSAAAIAAAFEAGEVRRVFAGADAPNDKSIAVMQRLGMRFVRDVAYPMGSGVEYEILAEEADAARLPDGLPILGGSDEGTSG